MSLYTDVPSEIHSSPLQEKKEKEKKEKPEKVPAKRKAPSGKSNGHSK